VKLHRNLHRRLFGVLLRVYPRSFRNAYGEEMTELFLTRLDGLRTGTREGSVPALWVRMLKDTAMCAIAERWSEWTANRSDTVDRRGATMMDRIGQDIVVAARRLARTPGFTLAAIAIAALGIGANTASFALVDALLFRPPPFRDVDQVVRIYQDSDDGDPSSSSYPATRDMAEFTNVFSGVAAWSPDALTWDAPEGPRRMAIEYVTSNYLSVLGLEPSLGRWFEPAHDHVGAGAYAVISHSAWQTMFSSDPGIVGQTIGLNGQPVTVLGVGPASFNGSGGALVTDAWLSISSVVLSGGFRVANLDRREDHWYQTWARLAPGVTIAQAQSAMTALATRLGETFPELNKGRDITVFRANDIRIHPQVDGSLRMAGRMLMLVVGLVLLLACANLAGLLLVRGMARSSEIAVRRALGASRGRVAGLMLTEALILSLAGGAVGLLLARWILSLVPGLPLPLPGGGELVIGLDGRVVGFAIVLVLSTGILFGLVPALRAAGVDLSATLRRDVRSAGHGRRVPVLRNALVVVQVAISLVLLVGSGLLVRSLGKLSSIDAGIDARRVAYLRVNPGQAGMTAEQATVAVDELRERLGALPGVERVAFATRLPVQDGGTSTMVVDGYSPPSGTGSVELTFSFVSPGYFETVGVPMRSGRGFTDSDIAGGTRVLMVNETAARRFWGGDAVGRRMRPQSAQDRWLDVIGVVGDTKVRQLGEPATPLIYAPLAGAGAGAVYILVRSSGDASAIVEAIRGETRATNPSLPISDLGTLDHHLLEGLASPRMVAELLGGFSAIAMLLTALGINAVLSFSVARRTGELGIRMALGAERRSVVAAVVGEVLLSVLIGLAIGFAVAAVAAVRVEPLLFGVHGLDPAAFALAASLLLLIAGIAAYLPARRAVAIDPVEALRTQV
jgi:putative ABC transport system permease protein